MMQLPIFYLLIVPYGIEILNDDSELDVYRKLLIVPYGIEINP